MKARIHIITMYRGQAAGGSRSCHFVPHTDGTVRVREVLHLEAQSAIVSDRVLPRQEAAAIWNTWRKRYVTAAPRTVEVA